MNVGYHGVVVGSITGACRGAFEAHVTVDAGDRREAFVALCKELGVKCVWIELARGAHPTQPMTSSHHEGELAAIAGEVERLRERLAAAGFPVTRVKLEADVTNEGVPVEAAPAGTYFEFHAKVTGDVEALRALCVAHGAHLSRNDHDRDGSRFVTLRVYEAGRDRATAAFAALRAQLAEAGYRLGPTKAEYTIYDSRVELDAGWLP